MIVTKKSKYPVAIRHSRIVENKKDDEKEKE